MRTKSSKRNIPLSRKRSSDKAAITIIEPDANENGITFAKTNIPRYADLARQLVLAAWPEIVQGLIQKAVAGGYQQTRLLLDICEFAEQEKSLGNAERQLCDVLLEGLALTPICSSEPGSDIVSNEKPDNSKPCEI